MFCIYPVVKRALDLLFSFIALFTLSPIFFILIIAIALDSKGNIIFKQKRLGFHGRVFTMYKFRSMVNDAEKHGSKQYSFKDDPRVTQIGRIIRATSLDELPQLFNIIKGDMSCIGPRPTLTYHPHTYNQYTDNQRKRFQVLPGITGWAQIHGRKSINWEKRFEYDIYYVDHMSFILDVKIFFITIIKVLSKEENMNTNKTV